MEIDRKTLKALAADTRLEILKSLSKRRKMPSELSKELKLATSTITEHLDRLEEADLIRREETGHKWIYYQLTEKGENLIRPKVPVQFILVLSVSVIIILAGFVYINSSGANISADKGYLTEPSTLGQSMPSRTEANITNQTNVTNSTIPVK
jgi:DNA-binding transcriptional ArsR family regulator